MIQVLVKELKVGRSGKEKARLHHRSLNYLLDNHVSNSTLLPDTKTKSNFKLGWITTQFCHPITFTYKFSPDSNTSALCDFCRNASTEIYGLGKKTLKVIDPLDGTGYIEAYGGGHLADGLNPTFLCDGCTYARSSIYDCDRFEGEHLIIAMDNKEELEVIASSAKKTAQVMATLDERKAAGKEIKICSICMWLFILQ